MGARDALSREQFQAQLTTKVHDNGGVLAYHPDHGIAGELQFDPETKKVLSVNVKPEVRRKGVATAMFRAAQASGHDLQHDTTRTRAGSAWARSVTPDVPRAKPVR